MGIKDDMEDVQEAVINELITENGITNTLADGQVTETKIANGAVTAAKLGSDVSLTVADGSITPAKLDRAYLESTGGKVGIGLNNAADYFADNLVVKAPAEGGITIASTATTNNAYLMFADGTSGNAAYRGYIAYAHNSPENLQAVSYGYMRFYTSADGSTATERMRIQADGTIKISNSSTPLTPSGGGVLYVYNGALYFRGSSGTITQLASA